MQQSKFSNNDKIIEALLNELWLSLDNKEEGTVHCPLDPTCTNYVLWTDEIGSLIRRIDAKIRYHEENLYEEYFAATDDVVSIAKNHQAIETLEEVKSWL